MNGLYTPPPPPFTKEIVRDILRWDVVSWSGILDYWEKHIDWNTVDRCLELGGLQGGLSLWLALKGKQVLCSNLFNAKAVAEPLHRKYGVHDLISYQDIDASNIPYQDQFDIIIFKSIIGGIGCNDNIEIQQQVFNEIYKALKPGGKLLFAENLVGSSLHRYLRSRFVQWGKTWRYVSLEEMSRFLSSYKSYRVKAMGITGLLGRREWQRNVLGSIDRFILNRICPDHWKYIGFGIAEK